MSDKLIEQFKEVTSKTHEEQAIYFLNAFWAEHEKDAEDVWKWTQKFIELEKAAWNTEHKDEKTPYKQGADLNEVLAHKVLESFGEPLSAIKLREVLRTIDLDSNKRVSLIEYALYKLKGDVKDLLDEKRLVNHGVPQELTDAQAAHAETVAAIEKVEKEKARLQAESEGTGVKANAAKASLAQLLQEDHLELNKAVAHAAAKVRAAQKLEGPQPRGAIWWVGRQQQEAAKYKPQKSQS